MTDIEREREKEIAKVYVFLFHEVFLVCSEMWHLIKLFRVQGGSTIQLRVFSIATILIENFSRKKFPGSKSTSIVLQKTSISINFNNTN